MAAETLSLVLEANQMPKCQQCKEDVDEVESFKVGNKRKKLCADCLEIAEEQSEIAEMSESAVQDMMGYKGRW